MRIYVKTDPENQTLKRPTYGGDAGYDITASEDPTIVGIVDSGYRNTIKLRFKYISQPEDLELIVSKAQDNEDSVFSLAGLKINQEKIYKKGDKIGQVVFTGHNQPFIDFTNDLPLSDRAFDGFGSTGR